MTGEDMIVKAAARLLREARDDEHMELRHVFWIAGYCEHCGEPHCNDGKMRCPGCKRSVPKEQGVKTSLGTLCASCASAVG